MCGLQVLQGTHGNKNRCGVARGQHCFNCRVVRWWLIIRRAIPIQDPEKRRPLAALFLDNKKAGTLEVNTDSMTIINTSLETFEQDVLTTSRERPVLVDFWAEWCSPCLVIGPVLDQVIKELAGALGLAKLEVDQGENMKLAGHYRVRGFPTVILFDNGREAGRFSGARSRTQILSFIRDHIDIADPV